MAALLAGSWRAEPPPFSLSEAEVARVAPLLIEAGGAALAWWRLRNTGLGGTPVAEELRQSYRSNALFSAVQQRGVAAAFTRLRAAAIEPVLLKGWAAARRYPEACLRPPGDIDLFVRPQHRAQARDLLAAPELCHHQFDLKHSEFDSLDESAHDEIYARSRQVELGVEPIRVLGAEDDLRFLCSHLMRHGARRPIWLCDVAVSLEQLPPDFDWDRCLGADRWSAKLVSCAITLAATLLDARPRDLPARVERARLPRWLLPLVLRQWGESPFADRVPETMSLSLRDPRRLPAAFRSRWGGTIEATVRTRAPFNDLPRFPFQLLDFIKQRAEFFRQALNDRPSR